MSVALVVNGVTYNYPQVDDVDWGVDATDWASAVTVGMLQKAGGLFQLLAEADFGTSYGLKSLYYKSRTANPADAGQMRLARADVVSWRNQANGANLDLGVNASDLLTFNGTAIQNVLTVSDTATIDLTLAADVLSAAIVSGSITNAMVNAAAAIAYSKLNLSDSILNADINSAAAIAYSKLNLSGSIVNADVNASAAIAYSKLSLAGSIVNADVSASAAIAFSKLATLSSANILVGSAGNVATSVAVTGDVTIDNTGVTAIGTAKVVNSMMADMAQSTIKGRAASAGTGVPTDLTATQATAILNNMVGDSGAGGTKGLVPAPAAGDAAASKFLKADGTWTAPTGAGDVVGPASSTNNGFAKFDGVTGKLLKNSAATIVNADVDAAAAIVDTKLATIATALKVSNSATTATAAATNSAIVARNGWGNFSVNNIVNSVTTTATAAGTTTLDNTSTYNRVFTGVTTQNCRLPDATASISVGQSFCIINNSTGLVTVQYNDATTLQVMAAGSQATITCLTNGTTNGTWKVDYGSSNPMTAGGDVIYGGTSGAPTRLANGSANQVLTSAGGTSAPTWSTPVAAAAQSDQETGTSTTTYVSPGRQQFHTSAAKAWVNFNGSGAIAIRASYNVSSITDNGLSDYTVNFTTSFSASTAYTFAAMAGLNTTSQQCVNQPFGLSPPAAGSCRFQCTTSDGVLAASDCTVFGATFFGDQ